MSERTDPPIALSPTLPNDDEELDSLHSPSRAHSSIGRRAGSSTAGSHLLALFMTQTQDDQPDRVQADSDSQQQIMQSGQTLADAAETRSSSAASLASSSIALKHVSVEMVPQRTEAAQKAFKKKHRYQLSFADDVDGRGKSGMNTDDYGDGKDRPRTNMSLYLDDDQQAAVSSYLTSHSWDPSRVLTSTGRLLGSMDDTESNIVRLKSSSARPLLGTLKGVLLPCIQNIFGVILFVRLPWITGMAGVGLSLVIVIMAVMCTLLTTISMSAIATNGYVPAGGPYYMISRCLGKELGVSVGLLFYLTNTVGASMYILGAIEILVHYLAPVMSLGNYANDSRLYGSVLLLFLSILALLGMRRVGRFAMVFLAAVLIAILAILVGLFASNRPGLPTEEVIGFPGDLANNFPPGFDKPDMLGNVNPDHVDFFRLFAIFFPSVTGIMAGSNRSGDLMNPGKSIPAGTLGAIGATSSVYFAFVLLFGTVCTGVFLRTKLPPNGLHVAIVSWPHPMVTLIGVLLSSVGAALQCLVSAPRLLQAVAKDDVIPILAVFKVTTNGEPRRALLLTAIISLCGVLIGSLDAVAPITTMLYLTCYAFVNFSTALLSILEYPNWRPTWSWYHWSLSLFGFLLCVAYMFMINYIFAIVAFALVAIVYKYVEYRGAQVEFGDGLVALNLNVAQKNLLALENRAIHAKNWRPQIMALLDVDEDDQLPLYPELLSFLSQLRKGGGLSIVSAVDVNDFMVARRLKRHRELKETLDMLMREHGIKGFSQVTVGLDAVNTHLTAMQTVGLGVLRPNAILMAYPHRWRQSSSQDDDENSAADDFVYLLKAIIAQEKVAIILKDGSADGRRFPAVRSKPFSAEKTIDVYWIMHDGGILTLLPYLLKKNRIWRRCPMRVFCIAESNDNSIQLEKDLAQLLARFRIEAEPIVLEMGDNDISEFTYEKTMQMQQREELLSEMQQTVMGEFPKPYLRRKPLKEKAEFMNTSVKMNALIKSKSKDAALIFLSLPRPARNQTPEDCKFIKFW